MYDHVLFLASKSPKLQVEAVSLVIADDHTRGLCGYVYSRLIYFITPKGSKVMLLKFLLLLI